MTAYKHEARASESCWRFFVDSLAGASCLYQIHSLALRACIRFTRSRFVLVGAGKQAFLRASVVSVLPAVHEQRKRTCIWQRTFVYCSECKTLLIRRLGKILGIIVRHHCPNGLRLRVKRADDPLSRARGRLVVGSSGRCVPECRIAAFSDRPFWRICRARPIFGQVF